MRYSTFFVSFCFSLVAFSSNGQNSQNTDIEKPEQSALEKTDEVLRNTNEQVATVLSATRDRRAGSSYFVLGNYSPLDLLIPSKYGVSLGLIVDADRTWEFEYLKGSFSVPFVVEDLGEMTDERYSLIRRFYFGGNSFNFSYGLSYFDFSVHLGNKFLNQVNANYPSVDLVQVDALGFNLAIGNRWTFDHNITLGVDWVSWAQPVFTTNKKSAFLDSSASQQDKENVDKALKTITYFPRLSFLKLQIGILF
ncbi:MAG: hypothetical protein ACXVCP_05245 [Bdellovibrio sp.]